MALGSRILKVTFSLQNGDVVLDETIEMRVRVRKLALAIQSKCSIDVMNLSGTLRETLLSQFTQWRYRNVLAGLADPNYVNVKVEAGYRSVDKDLATTIFEGQVVTATPISGPPTIGVRLDCFSRQIDKTAFVTEPAPASGTFKAYVEWAGKQMGVEKTICETSYNNSVLTNQFATANTVSSLIIQIQDAFKPAVVAFVDNNTLIVRDLNKAISPAQIITVSEFIGTPIWNDWGVEFECLMNPEISLVNAASITSKLNPSLRGTYVVSGIEYDLTSRDTPFYMKVSGLPPA
ncbi:baseplate hub protein [Burkholderia multivorans]|uniref:baseplate hub protein n=1 Tax=Burkholderia multivorans TaxID=87883 RepID=UPI001B925FE6|nr:hypothetical protein [Burkholderia multivorans]MBR8019530.1 hypothetical protein [Burkholderia multivorans]MDN8008211.1 hypothetical protein [Burkholderia multivorans]HEF4730000.1 hypothetical protein [Burkholderia multivorans]HEF4734296.1 hypothetical protein [Burkholderia multivorans]